MELLPWIIMVFTLLQFMVALANVLFKPVYQNCESNVQELVSVLIPARNEAQNIGNLLSDILQQTYSKLEIIVFNDESTDQTEEIVRDLAQKDSRIQLINSDGLPDGWLGKNRACYEIGNRANGNYLLFLDADVQAGRNMISQTVNYLKTHRLALLSIFPKQQMKTIGEKITVPNMNYILLSLLPLALVEKTSIPSLSAANGQFMLFNTETYRETQPHEKLKASKVEDIGISRLFKKAGLKVGCHSATGEISCRMYNSYHEAVHGFSKNVVMFFGNSTVLAIVFWLISTLGFLIILIEMPVMVFTGYLFVIVLTRVFVAIASKQNSFINVLLFSAQQITMGIFIVRSVVNRYRKNYEWKGRKITS